MKKLVLLRHAKSDWSDPKTRDFDRPINERGRKGAALIGKVMRERAMRFDAVIASPAIRVVETLAIVEQVIGQPFETGWDRRVYLASSATLCDLLRELPEGAETVLMAGHNPGLEDLILELVPDDGTSPLREEIEVKFPTAALAEMEIAVDRWSDLDDRKAKLVRLTRPRDLDPALGPEMA